MKKMFYMIENHPADSRVQIDDSGTCQTLSARMGTGGGNVPMVMFIASSHPGSYTGQDAYNDMLPVIRRDIECTTGHGKATPNSHKGGRQVL